jgi:hypothetical protein
MVATCNKVSLNDATAGPLEMTVFTIPDMGCFGIELITQAIVRRRGQGHGARACAQSEGFSRMN